MSTRIDNHYRNQIESAVDDFIKQYGFRYPEHPLIDVAGEARFALHNLIANAMLADLLPCFEPAPSISDARDAFCRVGVRIVLEWLIEVNNLVPNSEFYVGRHVAEGGAA